MRELNKEYRTSKTLPKIDQSQMYLMHLNSRILLKASCIISVFALDVVDCWKQPVRTKQNKNTYGNIFDKRLIKPAFLPLRFKKNMSKLSYCKYVEACETHGSRGSS